MTFGVDTNILIRAILEDTPDQARLAQKILYLEAQKQNLFISSYAILEMVWVLKTKKKSRQEICEVVSYLLNSRGIAIGQRDVVALALATYAKGAADFADHLILAEGKSNGALSVFSFDSDFQSDAEQCLDPESYE